MTTCYDRLRSMTSAGRGHERVRPAAPARVPVTAIAFVDAPPEWQPAVRLLALLYPDAVVDIDEADVDDWIGP
jgi:hypothetical protein